MSTVEPSSFEPSMIQFERRKQDHIRLSLESRNQALGKTGLDHIKLLHEALPELDFSEVSLQQNSLNLDLQTPYLVSSMTAGHVDSVNLNQRLAVVCEARGWLMGVGSQRRELSDSTANGEWKQVRKVAPGVKLLGNLGLSQLIRTDLSDVQRLVDSLEAAAMIIHTNPLQECIQPEGTPQFKGGLEALANLVKGLSVPVVVKETGCGFSQRTLNALIDTGIAAVDVSGLGGTHWGRIEGDRAIEAPVQAQTAKTFANWGLSTVESLQWAKELEAPFETWASGGVRSGLDAAKLIAMGATTVGIAMPILTAAIESDKALDECMQAFEYELKVAMFCTGCKTLRELQERQVWQWHQV